MPGSKVCKDYMFIEESYSSRGSSPLFFMVFNIQDLPAFFTLLWHPLILLCSCFYFIFLILAHFPLWCPNLHNMETTSDFTLQTKVNIWKAQTPVSFFWRVALLTTINCGSESLYVMKAKIQLSTSEKS